MQATPILTQIPSASPRASASHWGHSTASPQHPQLPAAGSAGHKPGSAQPPRGTGVVATAAALGKHCPRTGSRGSQVATAQLGPSEIGWEPDLSMPAPGCYFYSQGHGISIQHPAAKARAQQGAAFGQGIYAWTSPTCSSMLQGTTSRPASPTMWGQQGTHRAMANKQDPGNRKQEQMNRSQDTRNRSQTQESGVRC